MNYTELTARIQEICETTFTADQLAMFVQQVEKNIYNIVQLPAQRANAITMATTGNEYLTAPDDYVYPFSLAVVDGGEYNFLVQVDVNFIREAYPIPAVLGRPKYYALFNHVCFILGPTPFSDYTMELNYARYPESIVTAENTWLGDNFDPALLNGALVEAIRFMKGEEDLVAMYDKLYMQSVTLITQLSEGKLRQDAYRSGQARMRVA